MAEQPVFFDPSGRRRRRFRLALAAFIALVVLVVALFAVSIGAVPRAPLLPVESEHAALRGLPPPRGGFLRRTRRGIDWYARQLFGGAAKSAAADEPLAVAFHAPWDPSSAASLGRHIDQLDWVVPGWVSVTGSDHHLTFFRDADGRSVINRATRRPAILPMIQNALNDTFDTAGTSALLADPRARAALLDQLIPWLQQNGASGACFDFEQLTPRDQVNYVAFLREAKARFAQHGWVLTIAAQIDWNLHAYAPAVDRIFLMSYDEHEESGDPGPIASARWFAQSVANAARGLPHNKLIVAFGNYGYDWHDGRGEPLSVEEAWEHAVDVNTVPHYDPASGNDGFAFTQGNSRHTIWLLDAASAYNELHFLQAAGVNATALWRLGSEDPTLWQFWGRDHRPLPPVSALDDVPNGTDVDIEGPGEILKVMSEPQHGRAVATAAGDGSLASYVYRSLPTPYEVDRFGYQPKKVALTFDDGPDPDWTPKILDVLKAEHVPATFFIVGENALTSHGLLDREVAEGHEVGSHTYTHPNLADASNREVAFELNTTQRLFQAFTGRSLRLFRAPYFGDAEPSTADEIGPALAAQQRGYVSIGLHVDTEDWQRPGVQAIINNAVDGVELNLVAPDTSHNIVLLHDAGGDRSQTVAALPAIIDRLRADGYTFVPVSELAGLPRDEAMPPLSKSDRLAAAVDFGLFTLLGDIVIGLGWLFIFAISIGIARAIALSLLALIQARRENDEVFPDIDPAVSVTVMIPAFNEERVIERAVRGVLASRDVGVEVIVIDDGSADRTSEVVREAFGDEPRVKLLTLKNGGKARALNRGLELATSPIVIALDADTQFEPATIARLARWFVDPTLGAVAGNAKVGNRVNLITRWQALEYITAQNLERRALARLDAMTVVPGAVGAWRLEAIRSVGGYPDDTLAEDQDLTIAIQRAGWKVRYDQYAVAWTEAPETFRGLAKQRFRWAYGTLQCLWKHRAVMALGRPRGLAAVGLPQAIVFQIVLAAISPIIDLALVISMIVTGLQIEAHGVAQNEGSLEKMLAFWLVFTAVDLLAATIAFALERRERWRLLFLLIPQRVGYRQVMYYVVLKAIAQALRGPQVGWGKLQRTGRVQAGGAR